MSKFKISTKKSLFDPLILELETDKGLKTYKVDMIPNETVEAVEKTTEKFENRSEMLREQLKLIFGVPESVSKKLDIRDINKMFIWINQVLFDNPAGDGEKKKASSAEQAP